MAIKPKAPPKPLNRYGCNQIYNPENQLQYDRLAFAWRFGLDRGAPTRLELFRAISDQLLPQHFEWHNWTERLVLALCENPLNAFPGCQGSAKTFNVAGFAVVWWLAAPRISSVTFVSTSIKSLRRRGWAEIQKCFTKIPGPRVGNFIDSKMIWQIVKGDDKNAIIGKAVEEGSVTKVADDIKGVHTKRQMIVIDEATAVPDAIWDAIENLYAYPTSSGGEFLLVAMANPRSRLERFGQFMEPANGWLSVSTDDEDWDGKPQPQYGGLPVRVTRFDAEKSPNIVQGRIVSRHLPTDRSVEAARKNSGGGNSPGYWTNWRGFPPPEGLTKTVFSYSALEKHEAYGRHIFTGRNFFIIGSLDPARGGDRVALRFARLGETTDGKWGIQSEPPKVIPVDTTSSNPIDYQIVEQVRRECERILINGEEYQCKPEHLIIDDTGDAGVGDIANRIWSPDIYRVKFSWAASEDPCSLEDIRRANEVYQNRITEMHFRARDAVNSAQLKGVDKETAIELCNREFDDSKKKIRLQDKKEYKVKFGKSPDLGDTLVMLLEMARKLGFRMAPIGQTVKRFEEWDQKIAQTQAVYEDVDYSSTDPDELYADA